MYCASMGASAETELEMVERHVSRGETIIGRQLKVVERLANSGGTTDEAKRLLNPFQSVQADHLLHLAWATSYHPTVVVAH